ncbi:hypothetical protein AWU67_09935 [Microterricola viridarii]|uniref:Uncharacterized protein n=2 Tax=Microterricola viridarii TaxID=412690 RepID=A0A0X8E299_9MICO|nr:hypothetical protein AWU67_09935 [Microterricola viridarii]
MAALGLSLVVLSGCSAINFAPPGAFDKVDAAAELLSVGDAGDVTFEERYGGKWFLGDPPTLVAIVEGADAESVLLGQLEEAGFSVRGLPDAANGQTTWERGRGEDYLGVSLRPVIEGDEISGGERSELANGTGVAIWILSPK